MRSTYRQPSRFADRYRRARDAHSHIVSMNVKPISAMALIMRKVRRRFRYQVRMYARDEHGFVHADAIIDNRFECGMVMRNDEYLQLN